MWLLIYMNLHMLLHWWRRKVPIFPSLFLLLVLNNSYKMSCYYWLIAYMFLWCFLHLQFSPFTHSNNLYKGQISNLSFICNIPIFVLLCCFLIFMTEISLLVMLLILLYFCHFDYDINVFLIFINMYIHYAVVWIGLENVLE